MGYMSKKQWFQQHENKNNHSHTGTFSTQYYRQNQTNESRSSCCCSYYYDWMMKSFIYSCPPTSPSSLQSSSTSMTTNSTTTTTTRYGCSSCMMICMILVLTIMNLLYMYDVQYVSVSINSLVYVQLIDQYNTNTNIPTTTTSTMTTTASATESQLNYDNVYNIGTTTTNTNDDYNISIIVKSDHDTVPTHNHDEISSIQQEQQQQRDGRQHSIPEQQQYHSSFTDVSYDILNIIISPIQQKNHHQQRTMHASIIQEPPQNQNDVDTNRNARSEGIVSSSKKQIRHYKTQLQSILFPHRTASSTDDHSLHHTISSTTTDDTTTNNNNANDDISSSSSIRRLTRDSLVQNSKNHLPMKHPFNFLSIIYNESHPSIHHHHTTTNTSTTTAVGRYNISSITSTIHTIQLHPYMIQQCISTPPSSSIGTNNNDDDTFIYQKTCVWSNASTVPSLTTNSNQFILQDQHYNNENDKTNHIDPNYKSLLTSNRKYIGVTLWNVLHQLPSCDISNVIVQSILLYIQKTMSTTSETNSTTANFISIRNPSFDDSSVIHTAGYSRSYEHIQEPICLYNTSMINTIFQQYYQSMIQLYEQPQQESFQRNLQRLHDSNEDHERILLQNNDTMVLASDDKIVKGDDTEGYKYHPQLVAYIIVQYQPIESSYDPILVPHNTPKFPLASFYDDDDHQQWSNNRIPKYNRHIHPKKGNIRGFDHIYQQICATAISIPIGITNENYNITSDDLLSPSLSFRSVLYSALAMQDCFDTLIWEQYHGTIVSCRFTILNDTMNDGSIVNNNTNNRENEVTSLRQCQNQIRRIIHDILKKENLMFVRLQRTHTTTT